MINECEIGVSIMTFTKAKYSKNLERKEKVNLTVEALWTFEVGELFEIRTCTSGGRGRGIENVKSEEEKLPPQTNFEHTQNNQVVLQKYRLTFLHSSIFRTNFHCLKNIFFPPENLQLSKGYKKPIFNKKGIFCCCCNIEV